MPTKPICVSSSTTPIRPEIGNARFEAAVQLSDLVGALAQFAEQPRVVHRNDCLRREIFEQRDLLVGEGPDFLPKGGDISEQISVPAQRHEQRGAQPVFGGDLRPCGPASGSAP